MISQNNIELQSNNTDLQTMLDTINNLPVKEDAEIATITITGTENVNVVYVNEDGVLQFTSCSLGTTLQSIVGSAIILNWDSSAINQQVTGIDMQLYSTSNNGWTLMGPQSFTDFYDMVSSYLYYGIIQDSNVTIYAETD